MMLFNCIKYVNQNIEYKNTEPFSVENIVVKKPKNLHARPMDMN